MQKAGKRGSKLILKLKKVVLAVAAAAMILTVFPAVMAEGDDVVNITDENLKQALVDAGADTGGDGELSEDELAVLSGAIDLSAKSIGDITGLEYASALTDIDLSDNTIRDIAALTELSLTSLDVSQNYLDLSPDGQDMTDIAALTTAGCTVVYEPQKDIPVLDVTLEETLQMCPEEVYELTASVIPEDAADKTVSWFSSDETIVKVDGGKITAVSEGSASVTVTTQDGGYTAQCTITVVPGEIRSNKYSIYMDKLWSAMEGTSAEQLISNINNDSKYLSVHNKDGSKYTGGSVGTGMKLRLTVEGEVKQEVTILTRGDANGDGKVNITDYTLLRLDILNLSKLTDIYKAAIDLNSNGTLAITDYTILRLHILGLNPISESYTPVDPGDSVDPNNPNDPGYLDTISNPKIRQFLEIALEQQGATYVWGAEGPYSTGFDCSGFVYYCMKNAGYTSVWRTTARSYADYDRDHSDPSTWRWPWPFVELNDMKPGDLMFYESDPYDPNRPIGHIGIYLGNGYHIHASSDYGQVIVSRLEGWYSKFLRYARRVNW